MSSRGSPRAAASTAPVPNGAVLVVFIIFRLVYSSTHYNTTLGVQDQEDFAVDLYNCGLSCAEEGTISNAGALCCMMAAMPVLSNDDEEYFTGRVLRSEPAGAEEEGLTTEELALCAAMPDDRCYTFDSVQMDQEDHHNFASESCSRSDPDEFTVPDDASRQHSWHASSHASAHQTTATSSFGNPWADVIRAAHSMEHGA
eukprot:5898866-Pleurochrysis_carterae.AAC.1